MGNFLELQKEYGLLFSSNDFSEAMQFVEEICGNPKAVVQWQTKRQRLLQEKVNTTQWMTAFIDEQWRHA